MATTAPSWTPLMSLISGTSTSASKIGWSPVDGLKKMYSTPAALSCSMNSLPPLPSTVRVAEGAAGAAAAPRAPSPSGAKFCATALAATVLMPNALKPDTSFRRDIPWSRYCLINSFTAILPWRRFPQSRKSRGLRRCVGFSNRLLPDRPKLRGDGSDFFGWPEAQTWRGAGLSQAADSGLGLGHGDDAGTGCLQDGKKAVRDRRNPLQFQTGAGEQSLEIGCRAFLAAKAHHHLQIDHAVRVPHRLAAFHHELGDQHAPVLRHSLSAGAQDPYFALVIPVVQHRFDQIGIETRRQSLEEVSRNNLANGAPLRGKKLARDCSGLRQLEQGAFYARIPLQDFSQDMPLTAADIEQRVESAKREIRGDFGAFGPVNARHELSHQGHAFRIGRDMFKERRAIDGGKSRSA